MSDTVGDALPRDLGEAMPASLALAPVLNPPVAAREPFRVDTLGRADFVLEVLGASDLRKSENKALAKEAHRRIGEWLERANGIEDREVSFLRSLLDQFMSTSRAIVLGGKSDRKSRSLPHGVLGYRASQRRLEVEDGAAVLAWAKRRPAEEGLLRVSFEMNLVALKDLADRAHITPPGTRWVGGPDAADEPYVKPSPPALPARAQPMTLMGEDTP